MIPDTYLSKVLVSQTFGDDDDELKALQVHRAEVEKLLCDHFKNSSPTIRYGGSKAKGTMNRAAYDLDIVCYFSRDDTSAGETLEDIYGNVKKALQKKYLVEAKGSVLRLKDSSEKTLGADFHIDVVPGRFTDDSKTDAFLYRSNGEKKRLKTNLDLHIKHVKESGIIDAIRLMKLWKVQNGICLRTFVLELAVIKLLKGKTKLELSKQLEHVWKEFRDNINALSVEDPANPVGNDLSELLSDVKVVLSSTAQHTLRQIDTGNWEAVFGPVDEKNDAEKKRLLRPAVASGGLSFPNKPVVPNKPAGFA
jgi:hypothetical protein